MGRIYLKEKYSALSGFGTLSSSKLSDRQRSILKELIYNAKVGTLNSAGLAKNREIAEF